MKSSYLPLETPILLSGGYDKHLLFWNAHRGDYYKTLPHSDCHINCIEVKSCMTTFAVAGNPLVRFYNLHTSGKDNPQPLITYTGHAANVTSIGFEHLGRWFFTGSEDASIKVWDCRGSGFQISHENSFVAINSVVLHPNQTVLIAGDQDGRVFVWDLVANKIRHGFYPQKGSSIKGVAASPDGHTLAVATSTGVLHFYNLDESQKPEPVKKILAHNGNYVLKCRFSPQSQYLATTSSDKSCCLWKSTPDGFYKGITLLGHKGWVWDCAFSNDSNYIITGSSDNTCKLWDINSGTNVIDYEGHDKGVTSIALLDFPNQNFEFSSSL